MSTPVSDASPAPSPERGTKQKRNTKNQRKILQSIKAEVMRVRHFRAQQQAKYEKFIDESAVKSAIARERERIETKRVKHPLELEVMLDGGGRYAVALQSIMEPGHRPIIVGPLPHFVRAMDVSPDALWLLVVLYQMNTNTYNPRVVTTRQELSQITKRNRYFIERAMNELEAKGLIQLFSYRQSKLVRKATGKTHHLKPRKTIFYLAVHEPFTTHPVVEPALESAESEKRIDPSVDRFRKEKVLTKRVK